MPSASTNTMKAVRFYGQRDVRLDHIPEPELRKGTVKIRPAYVGICGTDLHEYLGGASICPTKPHPITHEKLPLTLGHEFSGTVEEVGEGVEDYKVGDNVSVFPILYCKECPACQAGHYNDCFVNGFVGLSGWGGGLQEHLVIDPKQLFKLPASIPLDIAALIEPLAVGWHAVNISGLQAGATALVLGGGPIGLCTIQALKAKGCSKIIVSEVADKRKAFASDFGADVILDPTQVNIVDSCRKLTNGKGVDFIFDAAGVQSAVDISVHALKTRGVMVNIAIWENTMTLRPNDWVYSERTWIGSATYDYEDFAEIIDALANGKLQPAKMITLKISLEEVEAKGFKGLIENKADHVKVLVDVQGAGK